MALFAENCDKYNMKKKIGLLGGAFDPIHIGHLAMCKEVLKAGIVDEIFIMPCYAHRFGKTMTPWIDRRKMCMLAIQGTEGIDVFDFELKNKLNGSTFETIKLLLESPTSILYDFSYIIGMDNANCFDQWHNYQELQKLVPFIVVARPGEEQKETWFLHSPHFYISASDIPKISSTQIRNWFQDFDCDENVKALLKYLPSDVLKYIREHRLYCNVKTEKFNV
jgi:nicotinate-nucleotide adenylyltransferase